MDILNDIENIKSNISDTLKNIKDSFNDITDSTNTKKNNTNSIHNFPKMELISNKYKDNKSDIKNHKIDDYVNKYRCINLNNIIKSFSKSEKAKIYSYIAENLNFISTRLSNGIEINKLSTKYLERALKIFPEDIELAYKLFNVYNSKSLHAYDDKGVEIAKLCIKLSDNKNIKKEFDVIYTYIGNYYYFQEEKYKEALDYYKTARDYAEPNSYYYINAEQYMAYLYDLLGDYKKSLEMIESVIKTEADWLSSYIFEFRDRVKTKVSEGLTKEEDDYRVNISNMNYTFKNSVSNHSEEDLKEAYNHYLKSKEYMRQGNRLGAVEEYKKVKEILPEETVSMDSMISFALALYNSENTADKSEDLLKVLNERLETALKTGKDICNVYNELGNAYSDKKEYAKAVDCYKKAIEHSGKPIYYSNLGKCYEEMGLFDEAIATYEKIKEINPDVARSLKTDYLIMHLIDIKEGRIGENGEDYNLAIEHFNKGNEFFNFNDYDKAFKEFNVAYEINNNNIDYLFRMLLVKDFYESNYGIESDMCYAAIEACEKNDDFSYLPFFFTLYGDSISYEAWGQSKEALATYEIAAYLLNLVPISERFAAPYYKLFRLNEQEKKYEEALNLLKYVSEIDKSYKIDKDVNRILSQLRDGGESNCEEEKKSLNLLKKYMSSKSYDMVIFEGKKALDFAPNNVEIYHLICQAAERKSDYYDMRWAAKEGLRLSLGEYDKEGLFYYYVYILGICCKFEKKYAQAKHYFEVIVECDESKEQEETHKAIDELSMIRNIK